MISIFIWYFSFSKKGKKRSIEDVKTEFFMCIFCNTVLCQQFSLDQVSH